MAPIMGHPLSRVLQPDVAKLYGRQVGDKPALCDLVPKNAVRCHSKEVFPTEFFTYRVFPYFLWSTGVVKRSIAVMIGGMPDYGSPYLTDFAYIVLAGCESGCVTINKALGVQTVHSANFGRHEYAELHDAAQAMHNYISERMSKRANWHSERSAFERYLGGWMVNHLVFLRSYFADNAIEIKKLDAEGGEYSNCLI